MKSYFNGVIIKLLNSSCNKNSNVNMYRSEYVIDSFGIHIFNPASHDVQHCGCIT